MPRRPILFDSAEHVRDVHRSAGAGAVQSATVDREVARLAALAGRAAREERLRRGFTLRDIAARAGIGLASAHAVEAGSTCGLETYVRVARALGLRPEFGFVDPRRRDPGTSRQIDVVHAAMGELEAAHLRELGYEVRVDEPYQHYQFSGRGDIAAWSADAALLHLENKTEFEDVQDAFGVFNAKRAYLGKELAERAGVRRWASETHVIVALWSADALRSLRLHRASFESVCPNDFAVFEHWWAGSPPKTGRHSILVILDPNTHRRSDARLWVSLSELDGLRPRYRDYAEAAAKIKTR